MVIYHRGSLIGHTRSGVTERVPASLRAGFETGVQLHPELRDLPRRCTGRQNQ